MNIYIYTFIFTESQVLNSYVPAISWALKILCADPVNFNILSSSPALNPIA